MHGCMALPSKPSSSCEPQVLPGTILLLLALAHHTGGQAFLKVFFSCMQQGMPVGGTG